MKNETKREYEAPQLEVFEVEIEQGFAATGPKDLEGDSWNQW